MSAANGRWISMIYFQAFVLRTLKPGNHVRRLSIFMSLLDMCTHPSLLWIHCGKDCILNYSSPVGAAVYLVHPRITIMYSF